MLFTWVRFLFLGKDKDGGQSKSFFEVVKGNPDLGTLRVLNNVLSYKRQFGKSRLSVSYNSFIYFDNICHVYGTDG